MFRKMYIKAEWQNTLKAQNLDSFDSIWDYEKNANIQPDWVEEPNQRRGGWSGVCRIVLLDPQEQKKNSLSEKAIQTHLSFYFESF